MGYRVARAAGSWGWRKARADTERCAEPGLRGLVNAPPGRGPRSPAGSLSVRRDACPSGDSERARVSLEEGERAPAPAREDFTSLTFL